MGIGLSSLIVKYSTTNTNLSFELRIHRNINQQQG
jgi:hypothetical protein